MVAITPAAMRALDAIRPMGVGSHEKVFGLSESQIARRVKAIAKAAGLPDWELFSGHSGRVGMARRHGPEWRAHPRDRTTGPLETGRRHGRPLHPRRIRRFGPALPLGGEVSATRRRIRSSAGFRTPEGASQLPRSSWGIHARRRPPPNPSPSDAPLGHPTSGNRPYSRCFPLHAGASRWDDPAGDNWLHSPLLYSCSAGPPPSPVPRRRITRAITAPTTASTTTITSTMRVTAKPPRPPRSGSTSGTGRSRI